MTLLEIIDLYHFAHAERIALTPRGAGDVAARRLAGLLAELDPADRFAIVNIVLAELARVEATA
jgi:hypothetical protein